MNDKNSKYLKNEFGHLFDCEIECGDGWFDHLENMFVTFEYFSNLYKCPSKINTIKQKFGFLRIYHNSSNIEIKRILKLFEYSSCKICEECGSEQDVKLMKSAWYKHLCRKCILKDKNAK